MKFPWGKKPDFFKQNHYEVEVVFARGLFKYFSLKNVLPTSFLAFFFQLILIGANYFTMLWVLPYIDMNQPCCTPIHVSPRAPNPLPPPSTSHPAGSSQC